MTIRRRTVIAVVAVVAALFFAQREYYRRHAAAVPAIAPAEERSSGPCVSFRDAESHAGENTCVTGYILRAYTSRSGNTFLDFCQDYRSCPFTSVVFASDRSKFGNLETLDGRRVELRGLISIYRNQAEIVVRDPSQIKLSP